MCFQVQLCYCLFDVHGEHFDLWHSLPLSRYQPPTGFCTIKRGVWRPLQDE